MAYNPSLVKGVEEIKKERVSTPEYPQLTGALGGMEKRTAPAE